MEIAEIANPVDIGLFSLQAIVLHLAKIADQLNDLRLAVGMHYLTIFCLYFFHNNPNHFSNIKRVNKKYLSA